MNFIYLLKFSKIEIIKKVITSNPNISFIVFIRKDLNFNFNSIEINNFLIYNERIDLNNLLCNPNVKLFITSAIQSNIYQAIYHKVNIIALGILLDQLQNAEKINYREVGFGINEDSLQFDDLNNKIQIQLTENRFSQKLEFYSKIMKRLKHKEIIKDLINLKEEVGFDHLLPNNIYEMNFVQYYSLDIIFFLLFGLYIIWVLVKAIVMKVYAYLKKKEKIN